MPMHRRLFFAFVDAVEVSLRAMDAKHLDQSTLIFELKGTERRDMAGAEFLLSKIRRAHKTEGDFHIIATYPSMLRRLRPLAVIEVLGEDYLHGNKTDAIAAAVPTLRNDICRACRWRVLCECSARPQAAGADDDLRSRAV